MSVHEMLAAELSALAPKEKRAPSSPVERRIVTGFEEILRFVEREGRMPRAAEGVDIFERLYATRLEALRSHPLREALLDPIDVHGILKAATTPVDGHKDGAEDALEAFSHEDLAAELSALDSGDLHELRFVRSLEDKRIAEEIAKHDPCTDFERFEALFADVQRELKLGIRGTTPFDEDNSIEQGDFFLLGGQLTYVAEKGEEWLQEYGKMDARLRVVYGNKTESNLLMRSLIRALHRDERGRRVHKVDNGPLFSSEWEEGDQSSGTIYVLRSHSTHPYVLEHREVIHKIGVTGNAKLQSRFANAENESTYLLAGVEVVATYTLVNIHRTRMEKLLHRVFAPAQLQLEIADRFGKKVRPQEWFLVPLPAIEEAIDRIQDGSIVDYVYDPVQAALVKK